MRKWIEESEHFGVAIAPLAAMFCLIPWWKMYEWFRENYGAYLDGCDIIING